MNVKESKRGDSMATSSILGNVNIKGRKPSRTFADALENSKKINGKTVQMSRKFREVKGNTIRDLFK